jgi:dephospho-CoA kinase
MDQNTHIVGIGGLPRSGKDTLAELFLKAGYFGLSFGDVVRNLSRERHNGEPDPISVANMTETSNWLRDTRGPDVILQEALRQYQEKQQAGEHYKGMVLWSIRAPIEVDFILAHHGQLIWVDASDTVRHNRAFKHLRAGEAPTTLEEFKRQEDLQWQPQPGIPVEAQMDIAYVKSHATDTFVNNEDNLTIFTEKAGDLIQKLTSAAA